MAVPLPYPSILTFLFFQLPILSFSCPSQLLCGDIKIDIHPPFFTNTSPLGCNGTYMIQCIDSTPMITFEGQKKHMYSVKNISYSEDTLTLQDQILSDNLQKSYCSFLYNFTDPIHHFDRPRPPFLSFDDSFFYRTRKDYDFSHCNFCYFYDYSLFKNYSLYYSVESENSQQGVHSNCTALQPPLFELKLSFSEHDDGLSLLSAGFSHQLELRADCFNKQVTAGSCKNNNSADARRIAIGVSVGAVGFIAMCCLALFLYKRRNGQQRSGLSNLLSQGTSSKLSSRKDPELGQGNYQTHIFSYEELQEATNGFDVSRELGDGGFGTVYKGKLRDGRIVAVKRLYENNYRRLEQFMNEVDILSRLHHQNLVSLYGCTSRHSRELLLVYEFIPNGTVADHLHGPLASEGGLPWPIRMSIAIETADALAYLHAVEPQIIHRDVKTNNILLDNSFHVKVADFGLSRLFPLDATHVSTAPQGTPGYLDPVYHQCYHLTDKSDIYSFGVVLVELISSKPAVDISRQRHEIKLANMAVHKIQNCQLDHLVDPGLGYQSDMEMKRMITQVAELAFRCLQLERDIRPCIKEVLEVLRGIESGGSMVEEINGGQAAEVPAREERRLLKNVSPYSQYSVTERWASTTSTTPNSSG